MCIVVKSEIASKMLKTEIEEENKKERIKEQMGTITFNKYEYCAVSIRLPLRIRTVNASIK